MSLPTGRQLGNDPPSIQYKLAGCGQATEKTGKWAGDAAREVKSLNSFTALAHQFRARPTLRKNHSCVRNPFGSIVTVDLLQHVSQSVIPRAPTAAIVVTTALAAS